MKRCEVAKALCLACFVALGVPSTPTQASSQESLESTKFVQAIRDLASLIDAPTGSAMSKVKVQIDGLNNFISYLHNIVEQKYGINDTSVDIIGHDLISFAEQVVRDNPSMMLNLLANIEIEPLCAESTNMAVIVGVLEKLATKIEETVKHLSGKPWAEKMYVLSTETRVSLKMIHDIIESAEMYSHELLDDDDDDGDETSPKRNKRSANFKTDSQISKHWNATHGGMIYQKGDLKFNFKQTGSLKQEFTDATFTWKFN